MKPKILSSLLICFAVLFISSQSFAQKSFESEFERLTDSILTNPGLSGLIVSYTCGDYKWEKAKGYADFEKKIPMTVDNTYRIGSVTKTFTISVLLQLVDEGKLTLDDKISKFFPTIPNGDNITVRMLADMRSGYYNYSEADAFDDSLENRSKKVWSNQELVDFAMTFPPYFPPNTDFHYANTNTILIAMIIEQLTGNKLADEVNKRIVLPLGLKNTYMASGTEIRGDYAHGYSAADSITGKITDITNKYDVSWAGAAGDMISDIHEMNIYLRALGNSKLHSEKMMKERTNWASVHGPMKYGLGMFVAGSQNFIGHNGSIPGYSNFSVYSPEKNCSYIVMFNTQSDISPDKLAIRLMQVAGDF